MTNTQPDTREQKLRDLLTIRDYLRERSDELYEINELDRSLALSKEIERLNKLIAKAEAEAEA